MVFEELLNKIGKRKAYSILLGVLYVLISYGTGQLFFPTHISLAMIFFITLLLIPSSYKLINLEEQIERKDGLNKFFRDHYVLMETFLFLFIGIFLGYLLVNSYDVNALSYQTTFLENMGINGNFINKDVQGFSQFLGILQNNTSVILIAFVLSLFYGVGALFLTVLNASVFSAFLVKLLQILTQQKIIAAAAVCIHFIPEVFGFLLASIAGGVISKAVISEKIGTKEFRNVIKDGTVMLVLSFLVIILAALLESFVTPRILNPLI